MTRSIKLAAGLAALGMTAVASAQNTPTIDLYPTGITLRGGVAIPLDPSLTNTANALADIGLEYQVKRPLLSGGDTYFAIDFLFKAFGGANPGTIVPITLNERFYTTGSRIRRSYFFVGLGASYIAVANSGWGITARGGVGQELGDNIIAEIAAQITDRAGGARANAIMFDLGYRF